MFCWNAVRSRAMPDSSATDCASDIVGQMSSCYLTLRNFDLLCIEFHPYRAVLPVQPLDCQTISRFWIPNTFKPTDLSLCHADSLLTRSAVRCRRLDWST